MLNKSALSLFLVFVVISSWTLTCGTAAANSWMPWAQGTKKEQKPILGMAAPMENKNGATPETTAAPIVLTKEDMKIIAPVLEEQTETIKALRKVLAENEAAAAARVRQINENALAINQSVQDFSARQAAAQEARVETSAKEKLPEKTAEKKPDATPELAIKPYVVPRAPVNEWQAIVDTQKRNTPPRGNITVKSPPPQPATGGQAPKAP